MTPETEYEYRVANTDGTTDVVRGHRVGDFAVRHVPGLREFTSILDGGSGLTRNEWAVDHIPTGATSAFKDAATAYFVADEIAIHLSGISTVTALADGVRKMAPWLRHVTKNEPIKYAHWLQQQKENASDQSPRT